MIKLQPPSSGQLGNAPAPGSASGSVLLIRFKSIGDIIQTLPAVHAVREHYPNATISYLTIKENAALIQGFRDVNEIIAVDRSLYRRGNPIIILRETISLVRRLRRARFSLVVDFQGFGETAWLTWFTGAPQRWGNVHRPGRSWVYTRGIRSDRSMHPTGFNLWLLEQCGLPTGSVRNEFVLPESTRNEAARLFASFGLETARPTLFIQPFTSGVHKNWPLENYLTLARYWRNRGMQVLFGGGPNERVSLEPVHQAGFPISAGAPLLVTAGLMELSTLVLGGDTGLIHLAVAMGKRVEMLMPRIEPGKAYPFQHPKWLITPPDNREISNVEIETVIERCRLAFVELDVKT